MKIHSSLLLMFSLLLLGFSNSAWAQDASDRMDDAAVMESEDVAFVADSDQASVREMAVYEEAPTEASYPQFGLHQGFSFIFNVGPNYAFMDTLKTSGDKKIEVATAGVEASFDIGYKVKYFGTYLELMLRGGSVVEDDPHYHCPSTSFSFDDVCFKYNAVEKGDWDTYFMGIGLMFYGFIPVTDRMIIDVGAGFLGYLGRTTDGDAMSSNVALKVSVGFQYAVTDAIALGAAINYEGLINTRQSIQPAFSLIYNY